MASPRANPPVRAIVAADFTDPMRRPLSWEVKKRLRDQTERIEEKETGQGTTVWGNEQGLEFVDMLSKLDSIISANTAFQEKSRQERDAFQEKIREHEAKIVKLTKIGEEHEGKIRDLTRGSKGYFDIRARFLCVYQRDHGKSKVPEDREDREDPKVPKDSTTIMEGNKRAHHGDAAMDAIVHRESPPGTFGDHTFRDLYYIDHNEALKLGMCTRGWINAMHQKLMDVQMVMYVTTKSRKKSFGCLTNVALLLRRARAFRKRSKKLSLRTWMGFMTTAKLSLSVGRKSGA